MIKIHNCNFDPNIVEKNDKLICTLGYEKRSVHILNKLVRKLEPQNILVFCFEDLLDIPRIRKQANLLTDNKVNIRYVLYKDYKRVYEDIKSFLSEKDCNEGRVYIDYSSMPRTWYSELPIKLNSVVKGIEYVYVVGKYTKDETNFPCAGIDSFAVTGTPSLRNSGRIHIIGIGYDAVRTVGIIQRLDPDMYSICCARRSDDIEMEKRVRKANKSIIDQALFATTVLMDNFSFMVAKLCEIAHEYVGHGDVIFVSDGPKPLIMAMSLAPQIVDKMGVVCVHFFRNQIGYKFVDVLPTNRYIAFSIEDVENY